MGCPLGRRVQSREVENRHCGRREDNQPRKTPEISECPLQKAQLRKVLKVTFHVFIKK
jgi:hypothetical protein